MKKMYTQNDFRRMTQTIEQNGYIYSYNERGGEHCYKQNDEIISVTDYVSKDGGSDYNKICRELVEEFSFIDEIK